MVLIIPKKVYSLETKVAKPKGSKQTAAIKRIRLEKSGLILSVLINPMPLETAVVSMDKRSTMP